MGVGAFNTAGKGKLTYIQGDLKNSSTQIEHETSNQLYLWSVIRSDIEYAPYLRLEFSQMRTEGRSKIHIDGTSFIKDIIDIIENTGLATINDTYYDSILSQQNYEAFLFYELVKQGEWPQLNMGAGVKKFSFDYLVNNVAGEGTSFYASEGDIIPMIYASTRYDIFRSITDFKTAIEADGKIYLFGDSDIYDYQVKMDFMGAYNKDTDLGVEVGYRYSYFDIKGGDVDVGAGSMTYSGIYVGFIAHFR